MDFLMSAPQQFFQKGAGGVFTPVFGPVALSQVGGNNQTLVDVIAAPFSKSGTKVRLTLTAGATAATISDLWLGHAAAAGNAYDFDGTQVQATVAAATSFTVPANSSIVTDAMNYAFNASKNFAVAFFPTAGDFFGGVAGSTLFFGSGGTDTSSVTAKAAGFGSVASRIDIVSEIEVFG